MNCTTHHHACDCREAQFELIRNDAAEAIILLKRLPHLDIDPAYEEIREFLDRIQTVKKKS